MFTSTPAPSPIPLASPSAGDSSSDAGGNSLSPLPSRVVKELRLETDPRQPGRTRSRTAQYNARNSAFVHHSMALMEHLDKQSLLSALLTRDVVNAGGQSKGTGAGRRVGTPRYAPKLATRADINAAKHEDRPPHNPPELPQCPAKDLKVPQTYHQAVTSEYGDLWEDSMDREWYGILDAGTIEAAE